MTRKIHQIPLGGLNYSVPNDQTAPGESIVMENWRVDTMGYLRSRRGFTASTQVASAIHSMFRSGANRYAGSGTKLLLGPTLSTEVDDGYDGTPLSFVANNGLNWVMNRSRRSKVEGSNRYPWVPTAPTAACIAVAGNEVSTAIDEFDSGWDCWQFLDNSPTELVENTDFYYDTSNKQSGTASLNIICNPAARYQARRDAISPALDFTFTDEARPDDEIRVWFYASDPSKVESLFVVLACGASEPRGIVTARIEPSTLNQSTYQWNRLRIKRSLDIQSLLSADPEYTTLQDQITAAMEREDWDAVQALEIQRTSLVNTISGRSPYFMDSRVNGAEFDWSDVTSIVCEVTVTDAIDVHWDAITMVGSAAASLEGEFVFYYTYADDYDHESDASPASDPVTVAKSQVDLTGIADSAEPTVTVKYIYAQGAGLPAPVRIGSIGPSTTIFTWDTAVDYAQAQNIAMPITSTAIPACRGVVGPYFGRLVAYSTAANPSRYFWTETGEPWKFPEDNWTDAGGDDDEILVATQHGSSIWFYRQKSIWRLSGDPQTYDPAPVNSATSAVGIKAVCKAGDIDFFVGREGIYAFNGDSAQPITGQVEPLFRGDYVNLGEIYATPINPDYMDQCTIEYWQGRLWFSYPEVGSTVNTATLVLDIERKQWAIWRLNSTYSPRAFTCLYNEGQTGTLLCAAGIDLLEAEQGLLDGVGAIPVKWRSRYHDMGIPDTWKIHPEIVIKAQTAVGSETPASSLTAKAIFDNGTNVALGSVSATVPTVHRFSLSSGAGYRARRVAIQLEGDATTTCIVEGVWIEWYAEANDGLVYDSGPIDLGSPLVKEIEKIQPDLTSAGTVTWYVHSDLPGGSLAQSATGTIATTAGARKVPEIALSAPASGRIHRLYAASDAAWQAHGMKVRYRLVPIYLTSGEVWESPDFRIAGNDLGQVKGCHFDYQSAEGLTVDLYTDLPGSAMAARRSIAVPAAASARRTGETVFDASGATTPNPPEGRLARLKITNGSGITKIWGMTLRVRSNGVYLDGSTGERWISQPFDLGAPALIRDLEIDCEVTAAMTYLFETEIPGLALTSRKTGSLSNTSRYPVPIRLPGDCRGQLLRLSLSGSNTLRLYRARVYAAILGEDGVSKWTWVSFPLIAGEPEWRTVPVPGVPDIDGQWQWATLPQEEQA